MSSSKCPRISGATLIWTTASLAPLIQPGVHVHNPDEVSMGVQQPMLE